MRAHEISAERAGADHQHAAGIATRQMAGGQRRGRSRSPHRQTRGIQQRKRLPGLARQQQICALHSRQSARAVAWKYAHRLDADIAARGIRTWRRGRPCRHQQQRRLRRPVGQLDGMMMTRRRDGAVAECGLEQVDERWIRQRRLDLVRRHDAHRRLLQRVGWVTRRDPAFSGIGWIAGSRLSLDPAYTEPSTARRR